MTTPHLLTIGQFAQLTDFTVRALRHYAELGLLLPAHVDGVSGFRYYAPEQLERAEIMARLRRSAISLDQIREFLDSPAVGRAEIVQAHRSDLKRQTRATAEAMRLTEKIACMLAEPTSSPGTEVTPMVGMTLWDQPVLRIRCDWTEEDVRDFAFVHNDGDGVAVVRPTCDLVLEQGLIEEVYAAVESQGLRAVAPPYFMCNEPTADGVWSTEVGCPVDREGVADGRVEAATLPGGDVVRTIYTGRFEDIAYAYRQLWAQINEAGFTPVGSPREIYVTDPVLQLAPEDHRTEVMWPIRRA